MSTPRPPDPGEQAWSEDPPTEQFPTHGYEGQQQYQYAGQQYERQPYPANYGGPGYPSPTPAKTPAWAFVLLGLVIIGLLGGLGYFLVTLLGGSDQTPAAPAGPVTQSDSPDATAPQSEQPSVAPSPQGAPRHSVPSSALSCPSVANTSEFQTSAVVGNTSCPFAEEVRMAYLQQPQRGANVSVRAWSPTTKQWYTMACSGSDIVKCAGGNNAVVYVY